jgi:hypothetical protein
MGASAQARPRAAVVTPFDGNGYSDDPVFDLIKKDRYASTANAFFYLHRKCSGQLMQTCVGLAIVLTAGRRVNGQPIPEWAGIPYAEIRRAIGSPDSSAADAKRHVEVVLQSACEIGLLDRRRAADDARTWEYRVAYERWDEIPDYKARARAVIADGDSTGDAEDAETDAAQPEKRVSLAKPLRLRPGKASKPIQLEEAVRKLVCRNAGGGELAFTATSDADTLFVDVEEIATTHDRYLEEKAKVDRGDSGSPHSLSPNETHAKPPLSPNFRPTAKRKHDLEKLLGPLFAETTKKPLDSDICGQLAEKLGDTPIAAYLDVIHAGLRRKKHVTGGLFLLWAEDAAKAFAQLAAAEAAAAPEQPEPQLGPKEYAVFLRNGIPGITDKRVQEMVDKMYPGRRP